MIVLKILLYIILAVLGLILIVLIVPAGGEFSYIDGKLKYKVKLSILSIMDSEGGGVLGWLKKRKDKPKKPKASKPAKEKKPKKKRSQHEPYEWEKDLDDIPVNIPDEAASGETAQAIEMTAADDSAAAAAEEEISDIAAADSQGDEKKKNKKKKDKKQQDVPDDEEDDGGEEPEGKAKKKKKSLDELIELVIGIWESAQRPLLKIFNGFKLKDLYIDFVIADEDAYDCALKYGKFSGLIYNGIAFFSQVFTVRLKTVDIRPAFGQSEGRWDAAGKLSFRLGTVVIAGLWFLITYIFRTFIPDKLRKRKIIRKSAARQK